MILSNYYVAAALVVFVQCFMVHSIINASYILETGYSVCNGIMLLYVSKLGSLCNAYKFTNSLNVSQKAYCLH
jgi:hypothetical protein